MDIVYALVFGLIATAVMSLVLFVLRSSGFPNAELVRGIASTVPCPSSGSEAPGVIVHLLAGMLLGLVYLLVGRNLGPVGAGGLLLLGLGVGLLRGLAASIVLTVLAADQDPWQKFLDAGMGVAFCHLVGNLVFGLALSVLYGVIRVEPLLGY